MHSDIGRIREALHFIPASDRDTWLRMAMAVKSELGDGGFELWSEWSQQDESYNDRDARAAWKSIRANGKVTIGTLFHEAKANGRRDDGTHLKPTPEELSARQRIAAERTAKDEVEEARERAEAAKKAAAIWKAATPARDDHPYLTRKGVKASETLREIHTDKAAAILGYRPQAKAEPLTGRLLIAPVKIGVKVSTAELIDEAGRKSAIYGGAKAGGYWAAQMLPEGDGAGLVVTIGEGVATVLSGRQATGHLAIAALSAGNLPAVANAMRERYPAAALVILADLVKTTGAPDRHAIEAAQSVGGLLAIPGFGENRPEGASDFNDMAAHRGPAAVRACIEAAAAPQGDEPGAAIPTPSDVSQSAPAAPPEKPDAVELVRLAKMPPLEYDRQREEAAKRLGCRVGTLDVEVALRRGDSTQARLGGDAVLFPKREPWPDAVDGAELLDELVRAFRRFIFMPPHASIACALWTVFTHFIDAAEVAPILAAQSAEKRSGKTTLLDLLGRLVRRALATSNLSAAALFRSVEKWTPTLMIDEADTFLRASEELRGLLNAGHTRALAFVLRCVGDDSEPRRFSTWGAKAIALIGRLPDTLHDRSIVIELRRRLPHERIERLRYAPAKLFVDLARQVERFAQDNAAAFKRTRPQIPEALHDRAADCWEPLLALADLAGGAWPKRARDAAIALSGGEQEVDSVRVELLRDVRAVFVRTGSERIGSAALCEALAADPEGRWCEYAHGKPITQRQLARLLRPFKIVPNTVRADDSTAKGYKREDFKDTFERYLPPSDPSHRHNPALARLSGENTSVTESDVLRIENSPRSSTGAGCDGVTDRNPPSGGEGGVEAF